MSSQCPQWINDCHLLCYVILCIIRIYTVIYKDDYKSSCISEYSFICNVIWGQNELPLGQFCMLFSVLPEWGPQVAACYDNGKMWVKKAEVVCQFRSFCRVLMSLPLIFQVQNNPLSPKSSYATFSYYLLFQKLSGKWDI